MHCELSIFRIFFHGKIKSYSRARKQNIKPESNKQGVISTIICYKDFHLYDKFLLSSEEADLIAKKTLVKRSEFSLIRADRFVMLSFMTLGMALVMICDKKGML